MTEIMCKFIKRAGALCMCAALVAGLAGCGDDTSSSGGKTENTKVTVLKVADFGAMGDGKTDDGVAIHKALLEAGSAKGPVVVEFEKDKTYYVQKGKAKKSVFELQGYSDITIKGENTTISLDVTKRIDKYFNLNECENVKIDGFNFKTSTPVYSLSTVEALDFTNYTMDIKTDISLGITETYEKECFDTFGLPLTDYNRNHMFYSKIEILDAANNRYRVFLENKDNLVTKMTAVQRDKLRFIIPMPYWGYTESNASGMLLVTNSENVELTNLNVWSYATFGFHFRYDRGEMLIKNVNVTPEPGTDLAMTGWRDTYHLKSNRGKFTFDNCFAEKCHDDLFNFGMTSCEIDKVYADNEFNMICSEFKGTLYGATLKEGDSVTIYDELGGKYFINTKIKKVVEQDGEINHIIVEDKIDWLQEGLSVSIEELSQPGSVIRNSKFNGTWRFRSQMTIENCEWETLYGWIQNNIYLEGNIPNNIYWKNCKFTPIKAPNPADSSFDSQYMISMGVATQSGKVAQYYEENIVFEDCEIDTSLINTFGDTCHVKFIKDGKVYQEIIPEQMK